MRKSTVIKRVCFVGTPYALLLYLLYAELSDINKTLFVFGRGFDDKISSKFTTSINLNSRISHSNNKIIYLLYSIFIRLKIKLLLPDKYEIFAQDHLAYSHAIIGNNQYTLIEDSAYKCSQYENHDPLYLENCRLKSSWRFFVKKKIFGGTVYGIHGNNDLCNSILMSTMDNAGYLKSKTKLICRIQNKWESAGIDKQQYILHVFDVSKDDIYNLSRPFVIYTQPLYPDVLTLEEHIDLYSHIIERYDPQSLLIKVHPRDIVAYESLFPSLHIYRKNIPSQLINALGIRYEKAITVFSSAVMDIGYNVAIDWYGTEIHPKILAKYGHCDGPKKSKTCIL